MYPPTENPLCMGSLLSGVLASVFLEFLECQPFKHIRPNDIKYFRYIDDILIIYLKEYKSYKNSTKLNRALISLTN